MGGGGWILPLLDCYDYWSTCGAKKEEECKDMDGETSLDLGDHRICPGWQGGSGKV